MNCTARLASGPFDPAEELTEVISSAGGAGGVVSFTGLARATTKAGDAIDRLVLDHHPRLTLRSLQEIAAGAFDRFDVSRVAVVHRCGEILPDEPIVFAAAAAAHRRAAFEAVDYLMDRLKTEAIFWKREDGPGGSQWVEPTDADHSDRGRWE